RSAPPDHVRAVAVAVEIELVQAAVVVVHAALFQLARLVLLAGDGLALARRLGLAARTERAPVGGAGLRAPEQAVRQVTDARAARHAQLAAARALREPPRHAIAIAAARARNGRLVLVDDLVAVVVDAVADLGLRAAHRRHVDGPRVRR